MIKTGELEHIVKLAIFSSYIADERPVSILISARVESGKTELLQKAKQCDGILYLNDVTAYGLQKHYLTPISEGAIRTVIIPDLITPLSRSGDTVETFIAFLNMILLLALFQTTDQRVIIRGPFVAKIR